MCIATGPVQRIWVVVAKDKKKERPDWYKAYFSRKDWAEDSQQHWSSLEWYARYEFVVEEHELDYFMRCH